MSERATDQETSTHAAPDREDARLVLRRTLPVPPEVVYRAWTAADRMAPWLAPGEARASVEADARPGGRYEVVMEGVEDGGTYTVRGEYLELVPHRRIVMTWEWEGGDAELTRLTIELSPVPSGTEMVVTHDRFLTSESRDRHIQGWEACFAKLEELLAR